MTIAEQGLRPSKEQNFVDRVGIYLTPEQGVAKLYATEFEHEGIKYNVIFQNRVNPKYIKMISKKVTKVGTYWLSSKGANDGDGDMSQLIRLCAMCIFKP